MCHITILCHITIVYHDCERNHVASYGHVKLSFHVENSAAQVAVMPEKNFVSSARDVELKLRK